MINKYQSFPFHGDEVIHLYKGIRSWTQMNEAISFKNSTWRQKWSKYISDCAFFALNACSTETNEQLLHANAPIGSNISAPTAEVWMVRYVHRFISSKLIQKHTNFFTVKWKSYRQHKFAYDTRCIIYAGCFFFLNKTFLKLLNLYPQFMLSVVFTQPVRVQSWSICLGSYILSNPPPLYAWPEYIFQA